MSLSSSKIVQQVFVKFIPLFSQDIIRHKTWQFSDMEYRSYITLNVESKHKRAFTLDFYLSEQFTTMRARESYLVWIVFHHSLFPFTFLSFHLLLYLGWYQIGQRDAEWTIQKQEWENIGEIQNEMEQYSYHFLRYQRLRYNDPSKLACSVWLNEFEQRIKQTQVRIKVVS